MTSQDSFLPPSHDGHRSEATSSIASFTRLVLVSAWKLSPKLLDLYWSQRWDQARASLRAPRINAPSLAIACPWRGPNPTEALRQEDPSSLSESGAACALGIILAPAIGPLPQWRGALLTAFGMLLPHIENAPPSWLVQKRLAAMCEALPRDGGAIAAHEPVAQLSSDLGAALLSAANPANLLLFFETELGRDFWAPASITGFGRVFSASFAERVAARIAAEFLLPPMDEKSRAQHVAHAVVAWKWLQENGEISVAACAESLADAAALVDWAWRSKERSCSPRAWRTACEAFMDEPRMRIFRDQLASCGASAAAKALEPLPEHVLRMELASAIDDSSRTNQEAPANARRL